MPASRGLFSLPKSHRFHRPPGHMTPLHTADAHQGPIRRYSSAAGDPHTNTNTSTHPSSLPFLSIRGYALTSMWWESGCHVSRGERGSGGQTACSMAPQEARGAWSLPPGGEQGNKGDILTGGLGGYTTHLDARSIVF